MGFLTCCARCLAGVPYASLAATVLCFAGVAVFCGCGHAGLAGAASILEQHFARPGDLEPLGHALQLLRYVTYGAASFFLLYGAALLAEGVHTTSAARELHGEFKASGCGRCLSATFVLVTLLLGTAWLGVFGVSAVPVFLLHSVRASCAAAGSNPGNGSADGVCVDARQFGLVPWDADPGRLCGSALDRVCGSSEFHVSFHLFVAAWAGAGTTVVAMLVYMMAATYNYAVLRFKSRDGCCTKF